MEQKQDQTMEDVKSIMANTNEYIEAGSNRLAYVENPLTTAPTYETNTPENIYYMPINKLSEDHGVSVYKKFVDMNGGILKNNDEVAVEVTIQSLKPNNKLTYMEQLK